MLAISTIGSLVISESMRILRMLRTENQAGMPVMRCLRKDVYLAPLIGVLQVGIGQ
jgi:hypothetical protein